MGKRAWFKPRIWLIIGAVGIQGVFFKSVGVAQNQDIRNIFNLVKAGSKSIVRAYPLHPDGQFNLTPEESDAIVHTAELDETLSRIERELGNSSLEFCPHENDTRTAPETVPDEGISADILFLAKYPKQKRMITPYSPQRSLRMYVGREAATQFSEDLRKRYPDYDSSTSSDRSNMLSNFWEEVETRVAEEGHVPSYVSDVDAVNAIQNYLIRHPTPEAFYSTLHRVSDKLTFDQKLAIASGLGARFGKKYNYARKQGEETKWGDIVDVYELLSSVRDEEPGGVCRDIATAQAKILKELGVKNVYAIAYATPSNHHLSLVAQDPQNKNNVYKIDYGAVATDRPSLEVTSPSNENVGINVRIYDPEGRPVASLPTDLGSILNKVTSVSSRNNDPFLKDNTHLKQVEVKSEDGGLHGRLFRGQTSEGDEIVGLSAIHPFLAGEAIHGQLGFSASQTEGRRYISPIQGNQLFAHLQAGLSTPEIRQGNFYIRGNTALDISGAHIFTQFQGQKRNQTFDATATSTVDLTSGIQSPSSNTSAELNVESTFYADAQYVQSSTIKSVTMAHNATILRSRIDHKHNADLVTLMESAVALREVGNNYSFRLGLLHPRSQQEYSIGIETPDRSDMPRFFPGSVPKCTASVKGLMCGFDVNLTYETTLESDRQEQLGVEIQKKF